MLRIINLHSHFRQGKNIFELNILDRHFWKSHYFNCLFGAIDENILEIHISKGWCFFCNWHRFYHQFTSHRIFDGIFSKIIKVETNGFGRNIAHSYIFYPNVFDYSTATTSGFKTQTAIGSNKSEVFGQNISYTSRHFASYHKSTMGMIDHTI